MQTLALTCRVHFFHLRHLVHSIDDFHHFHSFRNWAWLLYFDSESYAQFNKNDEEYLGVSHKQANIITQKNIISITLQLDQEELLAMDLDVDRIRELRLVFVQLFFSFLFLSIIEVFGSALECHPACFGTTKSQKSKYSKKQIKGN